MGGKFGRILHANDCIICDYFRLDTKYKFYEYYLNGKVYRGQTSKLIKAIEKNDKLKKMFITKSFINKGIYIMYRANDELINVLGGIR